MKIPLRLFQAMMVNGARTSSGKQIGITVDKRGVNHFVTW